MNPSSAKNRKLIKQYPFIADIMEMRRDPLGKHNATTINDLTIKVEKADGDLMYRRADNVGTWGDEGYIFQMSEKRKDQVMLRSEYLFAIDRADVVINHVTWSQDREERKTAGETYGWMALWATRLPTGGFTDLISDKVKYLVWVRIEAWYTDTKQDEYPGARRGEFQDRSMHITIYREPEGGFEQLQKNSNLSNHLRLDSRTISRAVFDNDRDVLVISGRLDELCQLFQDEVYFNGMKDILDSSEFRGASGQFGSTKVLCAELCGYDRVMLEDSESWVTFQLRPETTSMYVLGMGGTLPRLRALIKGVAKAWSEHPELRTTLLKPDANVSVM